MARDHARGVFGERGGLPRQSRCQRAHGRHRLFGYRYRQHRRSRGGRTPTSPASRRPQSVLPSARCVHVYGRGARRIRRGGQRRTNHYLPGRYSATARVWNGVVHVVAWRHDRDPPRSAVAPDVEQRAADPMGGSQVRRDRAVVRVAASREPSRVRGMASRPGGGVPAGLRAHSVACVGGLSIRAPGGGGRGRRDLRDRHMGDDAGNWPLRGGHGERIPAAVAGLRGRRHRDHPGDGRARRRAAGRRGAPPHGPRHPGDSGRGTNTGTDGGQRTTARRDRGAQTDGRVAAADREAGCDGRRPGGRRPRTE